MIFEMHLHIQRNIRTLIEIKRRGINIVPIKAVKEG